MEKVYIISGARTAVANFGGALKSVPAYELGAEVIREVLRKRTSNQVSTATWCQARQ